MIKKQYNFIYTCNNDIKELIKTMIKDNNLKQVDIMRGLDINKSTWITLMNKKHITLDNLKDIAEVMGFEIEMHIKEK